MDYAVFKITGKLSTRKRRFNKKTNSAIHREFLRLKKAEMRRWFAGKEDVQTRLQHGAESIQTRLQQGASRIEGMAAHQLGSSQSVQALLYAVVTQSWTAFETLTADLWFAALDHGLPEWRKRAFVKYDNPISDSDQPLLNEAEVDDLPDPQKAYGSSLRQTGKVPFQGLRKIIAAYKVVFRKKAETLFEQNKAIHALAAVRHVIAHKSGVADRKYLNASKEFPELLQFTKVKLDRPIPINGELVRELQNVAIHLGTELLLHIERGINTASAMPMVWFRLALLFVLNFPLLNLRSRD